jgi:hypothetical protein
VNSCFCLFTQIAYMDHLDLPSDRGHQINYSLPCFCHVRNVDFNFVMAVDKNKLSLGNSFGRLPVCATLHPSLPCSLVFLFVLLLPFFYYSKALISSLFFFSSATSLSLHMPPPPPFPMPLLFPPPQPLLPDLLTLLTHMALRPLKKSLSSSLSMNS